MKASVTSKRKKVKAAKTAPLPPPAAAPLLAWYDSHRRAMPWRALPGEKADPYRVWLSEVMLQQTTVATVGAYFRKFVERWPRLEDLASAPLDDVLKVWAGLGYYRRARMLHQCAQRLQDDYGGVFPQDEKTLLSLPGFGPYTAAAVTSIAFDQPANVVDGNVERVMARIFALRETLPKVKPALRKAASTLVPQKRCGDYAQALMDLGATVCTPRNPQCPSCPWRESCQAQVLGIQESLPRRVKAKPKPMRRAFAFVLMNEDGAILLRRRPPQGLLASMMEVPGSPWLEQDMPTFAKAKTHAPAPTPWHVIPGFVTHVFTHFTLEVSVAIGRGTSTKHEAGDLWLSPRAIDDEALPSIMKKIIRYAVKSV